MEQQQNYKTRTIQPDEKELIIMVLDESVNMGKKQEFTYDGINSVNHLAIQRIKKIDEIVAIKKPLFMKLDQRSYLYDRILQVAKIALRSLQDDSEYGYYNADLVYKFISLEEVFGERKLQSKTVQFFEPEPAVVRETKRLQEEPLILPDEDEGELIEPELTGEKLVKQRKKDEELTEALGSMEFTEDEPSENDLKSMDFND